MGSLIHAPIYWKGKPLHKLTAHVYAHTMLSAIKIAVALLVCYIAIAGWVYFSQKRLLYHPWQELVATPEDVGLEYKDALFTNELGTPIHGWWLPHENARHTVLFSHGNGGNISHRLETFRIFHQLGLSLFIYDYSGYGQSGGDCSEEGTQADARAAWDWLVNKQGVRPESIVLFGRSLGGAVTAQLAADLCNQGHCPAGLILESTFTSVPDMGAHIYPWLPVRQLATYQYNSVKALSDVRLPALFAHSPNDDIVPYESGRALYEGYQGPKHFMEMVGDHNHGYLEMGPRYPEELNRFLTSLTKQD